MRSPDPGRYWVNQPSSLQPCHQYDGLCVVVTEWPDPQTSRTVRAWPATGPFISIDLPREVLSPGWPESRTPRPPAYPEISNA